MHVKQFLRFMVLIETLLLVLFLSGCSLYRIKQDANQIEQTVELQGEVLGVTGNEPVGIILLKEISGTKKVWTYFIRYGEGPFRFIAASGSLYLFAFQDKNEDQQYTPGEPASWYGGATPKKIAVTHGGKIDGLEIQLSGKIPAQTDLFLRPKERVDDGMTKLVHVTVSRGEITTLSDARFSPEKGSQGLFEPVQFALQNGYGIYFLESYDPLKVPVLFVHGAGGCARDFEYLIGRLDRSKFQPWVYQYPSGVRLAMSGHELHQSLTELYSKYKFRRLAIIAHSMGGLVARSAINERTGQFPAPPLRLFVSLATPWDGVTTAESGIKYSPVVIPAWLDVAPSSPFLKDLFLKPIPSPAAYYLLFGVVGGNGTDGSVPLASVISLRAQADANYIYGFPEDHMSILCSPAVIDRINRLLSRDAWPDQN